MTGGHYVHIEISVASPGHTKIGETVIMQYSPCHPSDGLHLQEIQAVAAIVEKTLRNMDFREPPPLFEEYDAWWTDGPYKGEKWRVISETAGRIHFRGGVDVDRELFARDFTLTPPDIHLGGAAAHAEQSKASGEIDTGTERENVVAENHLIPPEQRRMSQEQIDDARVSNPDPGNREDMP